MSWLCSGPKPSLSAGLNLTEKIKKIKVVFTPTICKQTCFRGRCANSCEKGDTTTLYSQGGHGHDPKSGFRICESPLPTDGLGMAVVGAGLSGTPCGGTSRPVAVSVVINHSREESLILALSQPGCVTSR